jgi:hypothetical protein
MKVLLVGGFGKIGSRYNAILKHLGVDFDIYDPIYSVDIDLQKFDKFIIASPTDTHHEWCMRAIEYRKPFLVEKPLSKSIEQCQEIVDLAHNIPGFVVCNYKYVVNTNLSWKLRGRGQLMYDYYNPGDSLNWSCSQIIYLDPAAVLKTDSPIWRFRVNRSFIDYKVLEKSYVSMIRDFVEGNYAPLWTVEDGLKMTQAVYKRLAK